jgi:uncharacterized caspase-like protein
MKRNILLLCLVAVLYGCLTYKIPISARIGDMGVENRIPLRVALLIPPSEQNYVYFTTPSGRSDYTAEFPVGEALAEASKKAFSQMFTQVDLADSEQEVRGYDLVIRPEFSSLDYRFVFPRSHYTALTIRLRCFRNGDQIFDRIYKTAEKGFPDVGKSGSWEAQVGQTVAMGFEDALKEGISGMLTSNLVRTAIAEAQGNTYYTTAAVPQNHQQSTPVPKQTVGYGGVVNFGKYYALVIGNDNYRNIEPLRTAVADAKLMAEIFSELYGYDVSVITDGTRYDIIKAMDKLRSKLSAGDNLLIYYAGHGYFDQGSQRGYWLPVDAEPDSSAQWISNTDITDKLKAYQAKHVIVIADSCYSGTMTRGISVAIRGLGYLEKMARKRSRTVLTSGGNEPVADSSGSGHSPFAKALYDILSENSGVMDGSQLFSVLRRKTMLNANQTPQYSDIRFAGHDGGDFMFVRKKQ